MFEARLTQGAVLKKLVEAMKDLVNDANLDCASTGVTMQAMDSSHVSLVSLKLDTDGFDRYRCDRTMSLGLNLGSLSKILKCASGDDIVTLKTEEGSDLITFMFESASADRVSEFDMKLMDIDSEHLTVPDQTYSCQIKMPSSEFQRICRDLAVLGDTCTIKCTKDGVRFSVKGDLGTGSILHKHGSGAAADKAEEGVTIVCEEPVELTFALRYLNFFTKATSLAPVVSLSMTKDVPLVVAYEMEGLGHLKYFLAPKIDEEN